MKKVAPIIVTFITVLYLGGYAYAILFLTDEMGAARIIPGIIGLIILGILVAMVYTLRTRLKEIDEEDEDDLSKY